MRPTLLVLGILLAAVAAYAAPGLAAGSAVTPATVSVPTSDGLTLAGSYWGQPGHANTVLLLHMFHSDRTAWTDLATRLSAAGYTVLAVDFRGHGESARQGNRTLTPEDVTERDSKGFVTDAAACVAWLAEQPGVDPAHMAIVGASIGANAALLQAALDKRIHTLVLLSPGLDYKGLKTERAMDQYGTRSVFLVASEGDKNSADAVRRLGSLARGRSAVKVFKSAAHGTSMFEAEHTLQAQITGWLKENI